MKVYGKHMKHRIFLANSSRLSDVLLLLVRNNKAQLSAENIDNRYYKNLYKTHITISC